MWTISKVIKILDQRYGKLLFCVAFLICPRVLALKLRRGFVFFIFKVSAVGWLGIVLIVLQLALRLVIKLDKL